MASPPYARLVRGREKYLLRTRLLEPARNATLGAAARLRRRARGAPAPESIPSPRRLLVVHRIRIGDAVVITPLLRALRARYPETELVLMVAPLVADLMGRASGVDRVIPFAPRRGEGRWRSAARAARMAGPAEMAFVLDFTAQSVRIARRAGAAVRIGYDDHGRGFDLTHALPGPPEWARATADYPSGPPPRHQAERWLALGALVGAGTGDAQPRLQPDRDRTWKDLLPGA
ncbi:MAG: glycosyltransferase family 9 protein, partial [Myxococcota bacterium]